MKLAHKGKGQGHAENRKGARKRWDRGLRVTTVERKDRSQEREKKTKIGFREAEVLLRAATSEPGAESGSWAWQATREGEEGKHRRHWLRQLPATNA
ncbi:hypothetical protein HMPREF3044_09385 [Corynebacterium sp. HMSC073D01]|nr:hypothetical protein HMPREF3044_09385 [Corynebacterium sp. HMSC073D01]